MANQKAGDFAFALQVYNEVLREQQEQSNIANSGQVLAYQFVDGVWRKKKISQNLGPAARLQYAQRRISTFKKRFKRWCEERARIMINTEAKMKKVSDPRDKWICQNFKKEKIYCRAVMRMWRNYIACRKGDKAKDWPWPKEDCNPSTGLPYGLIYYDGKHFFPNQNYFDFEDISKEWFSYFRSLRNLNNKKCQFLYYLIPQKVFNVQYI